MKDELQAGRPEGNLDIRGEAVQGFVPEDMPHAAVDADGESLLGIGRILAIHAEENLQSGFQYRAFEIKEYFDENLLMKIRLALIECDKQNRIERLLDYATHSTGVLFSVYNYSLDRKSVVWERV